MARLKRPSAQSPPPRERILHAARELFYRDGINAVSVEAIAAAAGTNKMTLYRHFSSRDELVSAYLTDLAAELFLLVEGARSSLQSVGREGPGSRLYALAEALLDSAPKKKAVKA